VHVEATARRRRNQPERTFTTMELLEAEDSLLALCRQGRVGRGARPPGPVDPQKGEAAITAVGDQLRDATGGPEAGLSGE
jgi:hypothetical protein